MANYIGIPIEVKVVCAKIAISGKVYGQPTVILTYIEGEKRKEFELQLLDDQWLDSRLGALSLMRDAVLHKKMLDVDFEAGTKEILTCRLHQT